MAVMALNWPSQEQLKKAQEESALANRGAAEKADAAMKLLRGSSTVPATVQPTPAQQVSQPPVQLPPAVVAPRARLVRLPAPPPRAQLVRLPDSPLRLVDLTVEHIDETHVMTMPYGTVVRATLRGFLVKEDQLPRLGHIGDMWVVGTVPWVYIQVPGTSAPTWVDP